MLDIPTCQNGAVRTTCPYCGVGCGVVAVPDGEGGALVSGDAAHPANFGRLCSKGSALGETLGTATRLLEPCIGTEPVGWDAATAHVAKELSRIRERHGPEAIAFYLSGQLLTEDYYVANKFAKGFIGTPHVDTNSRLCMASSVAGHKRAFGADVVPGNYEDLDSADLVVLVGSNTAWCHPILYQRIQNARSARGTKVINIDPRRTATSEGADLHLGIASGSDTCLWNGLLVWLVDNGVADAGYISANTTGFAEALAMARAKSGSLATVALHTGLSVDDVRAFYAAWGATQRVVTCYSQGVNQSINGTDKVNAIINCHLATGRIAKPGCGPFSLTGQPNAMGGREVGGLANMLAAHMGFSAAERDIVGRFWKAPNLVTGEGFKAVEMFDAIGRGTIKALWIIGTNPAVSLPRAHSVRQNLAKLDLLVVSEVVRSNDTISAATVRLPAQGWGEKDGTVTNSERRISRQRAFMKPAGAARPDWWILGQVAAHLGWADAFPYQSSGEIFAEHAALSGFENDGARVFDISGLAGMTGGAYAALEPIQWPVLAGSAGTARVFSDGQFAAPDGKARFVAVTRAVAADVPTDSWPLLLNTGRTRDQWHTMTRTGLVPRLAAHSPEPFVEINVADAGTYGVSDSGLVRIESAHGAVVVKAVVTDRIAAGAVFTPIHWSRENSSAGSVGALAHDHTDPHSGQPDLKATPVRISPVEAAYSGFLLTASDVPLPSLPARDVVYWSRVAIANGTMTTFAVDGPAECAHQIAEGVLPEGARISFTDRASGIYRIAVVSEGRISSIAVLGQGSVAPPGAWLKSMLMRAELTPAERRALLAGRLPDAVAAEGPVVCVCHQVAATTIKAAIAQGCQTSEAIGKACNAGTNCGSCLPEINRFLRSAVTADTLVQGAPSGARKIGPAVPEMDQYASSAGTCAQPATAD
ncbi:MAG: molybdopterin-dependent oxidoreductase [Hyphomicrobium sp.]